MQNKLMFYPQIKPKTLKIGTLKIKRDPKSQKAQSFKDPFWIVGRKGVLTFEEIPKNQK